MSFLFARMAVLFSRTVRRTVVVVGAICLLMSSESFAGQVFLKNGDRITGEIVDKNETAVYVSTVSMGKVKIYKENIERIVVASEDIPEKEDRDPRPGDKENIVWQRNIAVGVNITGGNTETTEIAGDFLINRNHVHVNETTLKGNFFYSEAGKKMDARRWYTMARYAFSFTKSKRWYNFYRVEVDQNKFSDIHYRVLPATGVGYWFSDRDDFKLLAEAAIGWEYTEYLGDVKGQDDVTLTPRVFFEYKILEGTVLAGDVYLYPVIDDFEKYRIRSDLSLTSKLNEFVSLRLSLHNEYDSAPEGEDVKKNDYRFLSSLVFSI